MSAAIGGHGEDDNSKSAEELLRELALLNHNDEAISINWLAQMLGDARECIRRDGLQQKRQKPISNWTTEDIKSWADELKQQRQARELPELLAVACRACILSNGCYPRDAQLISILLMLSPSKAGRRGHLQQIATGEGKTAIVALFVVVVKALQDRVKFKISKFGCEFCSSKVCFNLSRGPYKVTDGNKSATELTNKLAAPAKTVYFESSLVPDPDILGALSPTCRPRRVGA